MLDNLKRSIRQNQDAEFITEAAIKHTDDDSIKDMFLDDIDTQIDGAEDDPEIAKLVDHIPEYGDDVNIDTDLKSLEENYIPETKI